MFQPLKPNEYWDSPGLAEKIFDRLKALHGSLAGLDIDKLAPFDQFHGGGKEMTMALARAANLESGMRVLDIGGGLGGPARTLATAFGCFVTVLDPTPSYLEAGQSLTELLRLQTRVVHLQGDIENLPKFASAFDRVWTQNAGMNVAWKEGFYKKVHDLLTSQGILAIQEPTSGPVRPPIFPLMWAPDASTNFIVPPENLLKSIEQAGFKKCSWGAIGSSMQPSKAGKLENSVQGLIMGNKLEAIIAAGERNKAEQRVLLYQGIFERWD